VSRKPFLFAELKRRNVYKMAVTSPLWLDPDWDNLSGDPRFEKLCQEK
jgi:hypothetical protein